MIHLKKFSHVLRTASSYESGIMSFFDLKLARIIQFDSKTLFLETPKSKEEKYILLKHSKPELYQMKAFSFSSSPKNEADPSILFESSEQLLNKGESLREEGKPKEAYDHFKQALEIRRRIFPSGHFGLFMPLFQVGHILVELGKPQEALDPLQEALTCYKLLQNKENVITYASLLTMIGNALFQLKRTQESFDHYDQAILALRKGGSDPREEPLINRMLENTLTSIGRVCRELERYSQAIDYFEQAYEISLKVHGEESLKIAECLADIGQALFYQKRDSETVDYFKRALAIRSKHYPLDHPSCQKLLQLIFLGLNSLGEVEEAKKYAKDLKRAL